MMQTKIGTFANSVNTDKMPCGGPSHQDLPCLPFFLFFFFMIVTHVFNNE